MARDQESRPDADRVEKYRLRHKWLPDRPHRAFSCNGDVDAFGDESLYKGSLIGRAAAEPREVVAGSTSPLKVTFTTGPAGVPEGTRVSLVMRGQAPLGRAFGGLTSRGPEKCELESNGRGCLLKKGSLCEGDEIVFEAEPFEWTPVAARREFKVVLSYGADRPEQRLPEPVVIDVIAGPLEEVEVTLPCTRPPGSPITAHVTTRDEFDNRVPSARAVWVGDEYEVLVRGMADLALSTSDRPVVRAAAEVCLTDVKVTSNPCVTTDDLQLYIGDLHCHDFLSEAEGYTDELYRFAIEDRRLDFVSVVPQLHGWLDNETWTITKYMNERYLDEGRFVTFLGFEWQHTGYGDKVVHYLGGDQPYLPVGVGRYDSPRDLYAALRDSDATVISHHPTYPLDTWVPGTDYDVVEADVERVIELWSMHGSSEGYAVDDRPLSNFDPANGVMAALRRGVRLGFIAGSDTHSGRPGGSLREPLSYHGGLAAAWAKDLTRRSLFEALRARRTCALTRARIVLKMTVNGAWMGSEIPMADRADIRIDAWAPGKIAKVELMKDTVLLREFGPFGDECHIEFDDAVDHPAFYHCRVTQADGELAVGSPVWIG